jgi:hypothetical protein
MAKRRKGWSYSEDYVLIENYNEKTIKELMEMLPSRSQDSINCRIKRLKKRNKIEEGKTTETKYRSYLQRQKKD